MILKAFCRVMAFYLCVLPALFPNVFNVFVHAFRKEGLKLLYFKMLKKLLILGGCSSKKEKASSSKSLKPTLCSPDTDHLNETSSKIAKNSIPTLFPNHVCARFSTISLTLQIFKPHYT